MDPHPRHRLSSNLLALLHHLNMFVLTFWKCTAGISIFAIGRIITDTLFMAVMVIIAILSRSATRGCSGTPYPRVVADGSGRVGCRLFVAAFAVAVISVFLYGITALVQMMIWRREKGKAREGGRGRVWENGPRRA